MSDDLVTLERLARESGDWRPAYRAACERAERAEAELRAVRIAYASEFPLNADGEPDVGSIHANIRALKAERDALRALLADIRENGINAPMEDRIDAALRSGK